MCSLNVNTPEFSPESVVYGYGMHERSHGISRKVRFYTLSLR